MSYYIQDSTGRFAQVDDLSEIERLAGDALTEFLDLGEADNDLTDQIREEIDQTDELSFLRSAFKGHPPFILREGDDG